MVALDTYAKKMNPPSIVLGGGVHGKVCWLIAYKTKCMFFPTNKNMKQCPVIFKNESIKFVKECCLRGFKISTDVLNRNIDATI